MGNFAWSKPSLLDGFPQNRHCERCPQVVNVCRQFGSWAATTAYHSTHLSRSEWRRRNGIFRSVLNNVDVTRNDYRMMLMRLRIRSWPNGAGWRQGIGNSNPSELPAPSGKTFSGAKALLCYETFTARLKPCPDTEHIFDTPRKRWLPEV